MNLIREMKDLLRSFLEPGTEVQYKLSLNLSVLAFGWEGLQ